MFSPWIFVLTGVAIFEVIKMPQLFDGEGDGSPLQYSCLENPMDRGAWGAAVHGVAEGRTRLSDFTFTFHFPALEKEMATHSSVLAWRIPRMWEPGGLPSIGSHRVEQDWRDLAAAAAATLFEAQRGFYSCELTAGNLRCFWATFYSRAPPDLLTKEQDELCFLLSSTILYKKTDSLLISPRF